MLFLLMQYVCKFLELQNFLGNKWSLHLLFEFRNKTTFNNLKIKTNRKISPTLLSKTLKNFKKFGIINKKKKKNTYYELTDKGRELLDIYTAFHKWGKDNGFTSELCENPSCLGCKYFT